MSDRTRLSTDRQLSSFQFSKERSHRSKKANLTVLDRLFETDIRKFRDICCLIFAWLDTEESDARVDGESLPATYVHITFSHGPFKMETLAHDLPSLSRRSPH